MSQKQLKRLSLKVCARSSTLSLAQVEEVRLETGYDLEVIPMQTLGDRDQTTSLRPMGKTDFFTREIDEALLAGRCDIAIHSAKDLPDPLPRGLEIVALTKGVDPSDAIVTRKREPFMQLPKGAKVATSSLPREERVRMLRNDLTHVDVRGTVPDRLALLDCKKVDALVVARAALRRLGIDRYEEHDLPGRSTALQGQLAIVAREGEMGNLFRKVDVRFCLYVGLDPKNFVCDRPLLHLPLIETRPLPHPENFAHYREASHLLFTSQEGVRYFLQLGGKVDHQSVIAVGQATASLLRKEGIEVDHIADPESQEGALTLLQKLPKEITLFWPRSSRARTLLEEQCPCVLIACDIYETKAVCCELPDLRSVARVHFTSPSSVDAFFDLVKGELRGMEFTAIGPVTQKHLNKKVYESYARIKLGESL